jgi:hypothetical protein
MAIRLLHQWNGTAWQERGTSGGSAGIVRFCLGNRMGGRNRLSRRPVTTRILTEGLKLEDSDRA